MSIIHSRSFVEYFVEPFTGGSFPEYQIIVIVIMVYQHVLLIIRYTSGGHHSKDFTTSHQSMKTCPKTMTKRGIGYNHLDIHSHYEQKSKPSLIIDSRYIAVEYNTILKFEHNAKGRRLKLCSGSEHWSHYGPGDGVGVEGGGRPLDPLFLKFKIFYDFRPPFFIIWSKNVEFRAPFFITWAKM